MLSGSERRNRIVRLRRGVMSVLHPEPIYGPPLAFRDAADVLRRLNLESALRVMAVLSAVAPKIEALALKDQQSISAHLAPLIVFLFPPKRVRRAINACSEGMASALVEQMGVFTPLSPWACSAMTDACLRFCSQDSTSKNAWPPSDFGDFGRVLLSFQKEITPEGKGPAPRLNLDDLSDAKFTEFTRNQIRANPPPFSLRDTTRVLAMFETPDAGLVLSTRAHREPTEWFTSIIGLTPSEYRTMVIALTALTLDFDFKKPDIQHLTINLGNFAVNMTPSVRHAFFDLVRLAEIDLKRLRSDPRPQSWSEALFKNNSLLRRQLFPLGNDLFLILDGNQFVSKFSSGLIHVLRDALGRSRAMSFDKFSSDLGYLFEGYVQWWFRNLLGPRAEFFFGSAITPGKETDIVAIIDGVALVAEANHHWLTLAEIYDASPATYASVVLSDFEKAIRAAKSILRDGLFREGRRIEVKTILPIAIIPEALPISDLTTDRFRKELMSKLPETEGILTLVLPCQILTHRHLEYFDRVWDLPRESSALVAYLMARAGKEHVRFAPVVMDAVEIKPTNPGNTWGPLTERAESSFRELGPTLFRPEDPPTQ
jgi:hypothetical protein